MANLDYPVLIEPLPAEEGGGFVATVPDLPGCMSDGDTPEGLCEVLQAMNPEIIQVYPTVVGQADDN